MGDQLSLPFESEKKEKKEKKTTNKNTTVEKLYYSIGEVADILNVAPSLIRFWEGEFPNLRPKKNARGVRKFKEKDIEFLKLIYHLVKEKGYTLSGAKEVLKKDKEAIESNKETLENLKRLKSFLQYLKSEL